jgi:hypothetical protein
VNSLVSRIKVNQIQAKPIQVKVIQGRRVQVRPAQARAIQTEQARSASPAGIRVPDPAATVARSAVPPVIKIEVARAAMFDQAAEVP